MRTGHLLTPREYREFQELRRLLHRFQQQPAQRQGEEDNWRYVGKITAATKDGSNNRWTYTVAEVYKDDSGLNGWTDVAGGRTWTAFNLCEKMNGASGLMGNGVDTANLTGTFAIKPAPVGVLVEIFFIGGQGFGEWWFSYQNAVDGECP